MRVIRSVNVVVRSMTGYGRAQQVVSGLDIQVEIRSVNHRYFEYNSRLPRAYAFLDDKLKNHLQKSISRGKVDVTVWIDAVEGTACDVSVNHPLLEATLKALNEIKDTYGVKDDISVMQLARQPEVLTTKMVSIDEDTAWEAVSIVTNEALAQFIAMREIEGQKLKEDVLSRTETILSAVSVIEEKNPQTVKAHMEKVSARMQELLESANVDEARLLTEAALFADKIAVAEETVRLRSHIDQLKTMLDSDEAVGRKIDFLVQEMNREANTTGSKCQDLELAKIVVNIKAEIEKIREQIQNIE